MIKYILTGICRNFKRNKLSTFLNLTNLIIGFTTFTLLGLIVNHELNYDKQNKNYRNIYRVQTKQEDSYPTNFCTYSPSAYRYHLLADLPEVEKTLLMKEIEGEYFTLSDGGQLYDKNGYWCENSLFDIFTINLTEGDKRNALAEPNQIILSEKLAHKLFPQGNAVGKQVTIGKRYPLTITGVYPTFPVNSTLQASYFVSMPTFEALNIRGSWYRDNWTFIDWDNYILLKNGADPQQVDQKIKDAFKNVKDFEKSTPYLYPLSKLHISPNSQSDMKVALSILSFAALLILVLSCINYVNLTMANSTLRAREIGIKKVIGSSKSPLVAQFLTETLFITLLAMVIGIILTYFLSPIINHLLSTPINVNIFKEKGLLLIIFLTSLVAGIASGLYPALIISAYNPVKVLKGKLFQNNRKSINLKKVLVVSQFSITLFMLVVSFILHDHVNYVLNKDLGFKNKDILFSEVDFKDKVPFETIRTRLLQHPEIADVTYSSTIPFLGNIGGYISWENARPDEKVMVSRNYVNYDFVSTYDFKMLKGRNFSRDYPSDKQSCIINETAMKAFGWDNPIGKQIYLYGKPYPVIGLVKDFHAFSIHNVIPTYVMFLNSDVLEGKQLITVRYNTGDKQKAKQFINAELGAVVPNEPFEFKDFSEAFNLDGAIRFWESMKRIFIFFAIVTILVSSMGLLGLMVFSTRRRIKEIGIRKVLGSSVAGLYRQLSSEVISLMVISIVFAFPMAVFIYKVMPGAYKEPLSITVFLLAFVIVAAIAIATISYHVIKVSVSNPVEALRYE